MAIRFQVGGVTTVIPSVYDAFRVANSLPAPAPAGRSVLILGEAEEGVPGSDLNLSFNFFNSFQEVRDFYSKGSLVDAARMLFTNQPSPAFPGAIARLYAYKTNNSTRAERAINSPSGYGDIVAAKFGEQGNLIETQIVEAQAETKPTKTLEYLPSPVAQTLRVSINGVLESSLSVAPGAVGSDVQTTLDALTDLSASGGDVRTVLTGLTDVNISADGDTLTLTKASGVGDFDASSLQQGDVAYIAPGSALSGATEENAGAYIVESVTTSSLSIRQVKSYDATAEANATAFDVSSPVSLTAGDILANAPLTVSYTGTTKAGDGAILELLEDSANKLGAGLLYDDSSFFNLLATGTSSIAKISATVPSAGKLRVRLDVGSWTATPKPGDLVRIGRGSVLAGAGLLNVGTFVVESASAQQATISHLFSGLTTEAVASVALASQNDTLQSALGFVSNDIGAKRITSATEKQIEVTASRASDGESLPANNIGGQVALEIGYFNVAATAATVSINAQRQLTISLTGAGLSDIVVPTLKYSSLSELASFLNTKPGVHANVPVQFSSASPNILDMVDAVDCLQGQAKPTYPARIKRDYSDFADFFDDNFGLVALREGTLPLKAGLPDAEANSAFLSGATLGATSTASVQSGLDAALKIDVRQVVPLFSRDAAQDVLDGLTDPASTYDIESIHAAVKGHVTTASSTLFRKERFGILSFYGSFEASKDASRVISNGRCQMTFQLHNATAADGQLRRFLPWMSACSIAAGRSQATLGTSMLRKPFLLSSAEHLGDVSLFSDSLATDFDPDSRGDLTEAIEAGLLVFREVPGFGVRIESPDNTTRSRENDPQAWVFERASVLFVADEVRQTIRSVLENFIGARQTDVSTSVVQTAIDNTLAVFRQGTGNGSLVAGQVTNLTRSGTQYNAQVQIQPTEALEAIFVDVLATRELG